MNINDFQAPEFTPNWLEDIFTRQTQLINKYQEIEQMPEWPMSIHTRGGQKWIKDFLWRTSEELAESYEAYIGSNEVHQIEELIDALHFITELVLLVGKDWKWAREALDQDNSNLEVPGFVEDTVTTSYWQVNYYLGMVGNTLKNKPWKQTEMPTDEEKFYRNLGLAYKALFYCLAKSGAEEEKVYEYYTKKHQVNQFRQRSNY